MRSNYVRGKVPRVVFSSKLCMSKANGLSAGASARAAESFLANFSTGANPRSPFINAENTSQVGEAANVWMGILVVSIIVDRFFAMNGFRTTGCSLSNCFLVPSGQYN